MNELYSKWIKWTDAFLSRKSQCEMNENVAEALMHLCYEEKSGEIIEESASENFLFKVFKKRAIYYELKINDYAIFAIIMNCGTPADAVMFCHALLRHQRNEVIATDKSAKIITVEKLCTLIFPFGFPDAEKLDELWDMQKVDGKNMLDRLCIKDIKAIMEELANGE